MMRYETIPHSADAAIIAYGATRHELFENAAFGMFDLMYDLVQLKPTHDRPVLAGGDTYEELLVEWLSELLYVSEAQRIAFCYFTVDRLEEGGVKGSAGGTRLDEVELRGAPIKAVTYHDLAITPVPEGWWARVVFDV